MTSVLFLKHLEEVVIEVDTSTEDADRQWLLERHRVSDGAIERCSGLDQTGLYRVDLVNKDGEGDRYWVAHNDEVQIGDHRDGLSGPAWDGVDVTEVSVAVRDADDPRVEAPNRRFHVFLPTQEPSGCSLLVNGAFTTDLSRQHVQVGDSARQLQRLSRSPSGRDVRSHCSCRISLDKGACATSFVCSTASAERPARRLAC